MKYFMHVLNFLFENLPFSPHLLSFLPPGASFSAVHTRLALTSQLCSQPPRPVPFNTVMQKTPLVGRGTQKSVKDGVASHSSRLPRAFAILTLRGKCLQCLSPVLAKADCISLKGVHQNTESSLWCFHLKCMKTSSSRQPLWRTTTVFTLRREALWFKNKKCSEKWTEDDFVKMNTPRRRSAFTFEAVTALIDGITSLIKDTRGQHSLECVLIVLSFNEAS